MAEIKSQQTIRREAEALHERAGATIIAFTQTLEYEGDLQATIHALYREAKPPYMQVRSLETTDLVKCFYDSRDYEKIHGLFHDKNVVVLIAGRMTANRSTRRIESVKVTHIEPTNRLSDEEFENLFGSAPDITGNLSTEDFIDRVRDDGET